MIFITNKFLVRQGFNGITLWPFVIVRHSLLLDDVVFINHEKIHLKQQLELLLLPFFFWYFIEFVVKLCKYKNAHLAYRNISFEREAYTNEKDLNYLKKRSCWNFLKYM